MQAFTEDHIELMAQTDETPQIPSADEFAAKQGTWDMEKPVATIQVNVNQPKHREMSGHRLVIYGLEVADPNLRGPIRVTFVAQGIGTELAFIPLQQDPSPITIQPDLAPPWQALVTGVHPLKTTLQGRTQITMDLPQANPAHHRIAFGGGWYDFSYQPNPGEIPRE